MKNTEELSSKEWNYMIRCVNDGTPRNVVEKAFTKEQMKIYDKMVEELKKARKKNPKAAYSPVENEW